MLLHDSAVDLRGSNCIYSYNGEITSNRNHHLLSELYLEMSSLECLMLHLFFGNANLNTQIQ